MSDISANTQGDLVANTYTKDKNELATVGVLTHWNIPVKVPPQGCTFAEVSASTGLPIDRVERILRLAIAYFIFCEPIEGFVAHTANSMALRNDDSLSAVMDHNYDVGMPASANLVRAMAKWPDSEEPSETAFGSAFDTKKNLFEWMQEEPWRAERFGKGMISLLVFNNPRKDNIFNNALVWGAGVMIR